ncbi:MAG: TFIIB-type zinc ribbon-containing protein [Candidatus Thalassarchaeum sp.]|nr:TFIIB-type zinc ribbon-containing protein [Candidatus Thalassarchaeum sp.]
MPKVRRPKKGWAVPKTSRRRTPRVKAPGKRLPRCPSCGQWSMKRDEKRSETYCTSCGVIGR